MSENVPAADIDYIIENVNFTMAMEDMPLTQEEKDEMKNCLNGTSNLNDIIEGTIMKFKNSFDNE